MSASNLLNRLNGVRRTRKDSWTALCPAHDDKWPSLSIRETADGTLLLHCFAGCETRDVLSSIGLDFEDLFPNKIADERKIHRPFHSDDILSAAAGELMVASLILSDFKNGKQLAQEQYNRLWLAVGRVTTAAEIANGLN